MSENTPLTVAVEGDELVIRIGLAVLAYAAETGPYTTFVEGTDCDETCRPDCGDSPGDRCWSGFRQQFRVTKQQEYGCETARSLTREDESGASPLTDLLDRAALAVVDDGGEGIEEVPPDTEMDESGRPVGATP